MEYNMPMTGHRTRQKSLPSTDSTAITVKQETHTQQYRCCILFILTWIVYIGMHYEQVVKPLRI